MDAFPLVSPRLNNSVFHSACFPRSWLVAVTSLATFLLSFNFFSKDSTTLLQVYKQVLGLVLTALPSPLIPCHVVDRISCFQKGAGTRMVLLCGAVSDTLFISQVSVVSASEGA